MSKRLRAPIIGFVGPMSARKTLMLLDYIFAAEAVGLKVNVYKPVIDDRFAQNEIRSRGGGAHSALPVKSSADILAHIRSQSSLPDAIALDEVQFLDLNIKDLILFLAENDVEVAFCGLNRDFKGDPFPLMKELMPLATRLEVLTARCTCLNGGGKKCGAPAYMTQRLINGEPAPYDSPLVVIEKPGSVITYESRCLKHWQVKNKPKIKP